MTRSADHILHGTLTAEGDMTWRLDCLPEGYHKSWTERQEGCACPCEMCQADDHAGCEVIGGHYIEEIGYECQAVESDVCWTFDWLNDLGGECIHGDDWPEDGLPALVWCEYDEGLIIHHIAAEQDATSCWMHPVCDCAERQQARTEQEPKRPPPLSKDERLKRRELNPLLPRYDPKADVHTTGRCRSFGCCCNLAAEQETQ